MPTPYPDDSEAKRRHSVAACVIAQDEEGRLPACLESLSFCDERIVVDGGSSDRTIEVARAAGARVIENPWPGFARQRNVALGAASSDWILEVDADERLSPQLQREILEFLADPPDDIDIALLPCRDHFMGRSLGPSARYPRYRSRLFRRTSYRHDESRTVHEGIWPKGRAWAFEGDLEHLLADSWREAFTDTWNYAKLEVAHVPHPSPPIAYLVGMTVRPLAKFVFRMTALGGWRDGWRGAVRITLDCISDVMVWARAALGHRPGEPSPHVPAAGSHFGRRKNAVGPVRLVGVAAGQDAAKQLAEWLRAAREAGADVAIVTDASLNGTAGFLRRPMRSFSTIELLRALDAEDQLRQVDAVVCAGARERRTLKRLPGHLRGVADPLDLALDPADAERLVRESTR